MSPEVESRSFSRQLCVMFGLCGAGADDSGPPGGGAVQPHPETHCWDELPICGPHPGRHEHTAGHSAAAGAGITQTQTRALHMILFSGVVMSQPLCSRRQCLSAGPGVVSSHRHAGGEHDVCTGEETRPATQRNHRVITHGHA